MHQENNFFIDDNFLSYNSSNNINDDISNDINDDISDSSSNLIHNIDTINNKYTHKKHTDSNLDGMLIKLNSFDKKASKELSKEKKMSLIIVSLFDLLFKNDKKKINKIVKFLASKNILDNDVLHNKYDIFKNNLSLFIDSYNKIADNNENNYLNNVFRNNYNQLSLLGQGSFGTVYKVYHKLERKYYAMKKIFLTEDIISENINLFNETHLYCNLNHKNIVKYYTSWISGDLQSIIEFNNIIDLNDMDPINTECQILFIQMELCNFTLDEYFLTQMQDDSIKKRMLYFEDILNGLSYLHNNGIIHRDLKSNNIFFVDNGNGEYDVKIGDFGLCKQKENKLLNKIEPVINENLTDNNMLVEKTPKDKMILMSSYIGNSYYRGPELKNKKNIDFSFDVYALGIILVEFLLTCKTNFEKIKTIMNIKSNPLNIKNIDNIATHHYDDIIIQMLNKNNNERPTLDILKKYFIKN